MARHPNHARFLSLLQGYAISKRIRHKTSLAEHFGVGNTMMCDWLRHTLPIYRNLSKLADHTGIEEFRKLRPKR